MLRSRHFRNVTLGALVGASLLGCPGRIDDPSAFLGPTGDASILTCTLGVGNVESQIIRGRCATAGCHERATRAGDLDLESAPLAARLVNVPSPHCTGRLLVSSSTPGASYMLEKLTASPRCGARMPLDTPALSPAEIVCVRAWIDTLVTDGGTRMDVVDVTVADVRDVTDVTDARDASDVTDAGDAMDVADVRDASDVTDASDVRDASDATDASDDAADVGMDTTDASDGSADASTDSAPDAASDGVADTGTDSAPDATSDGAADVGMDATDATDA